jgi:hypothetical protein
MGRGLSDDQQDIIREAGDRLAGQVPRWRHRALELAAELERDPDGENWFDTWCQFEEYQHALWLCEVQWDRPREDRSRVRQTARCRSLRRLEQRGLIKRGWDSYNWRGETHRYPIIGLTAAGWAEWERLTGRRQPERDTSHWKGYYELWHRAQEEEERREAERQRQWQEELAERQRQWEEREAFRKQNEAQTMRAMEELARVRAARPAEPKPDP